MADNFVTNAGSGGDTFGADDIGGVKYPRTKIIIGADGMNDGDVSSANPLPVSAAQSGVWNVTNVSGTISLPTGAATEATLADIKTAVQLIDNAVSGAGFNVTQLNGAAVPIGAGTEAAAVRVTLATDSTGVVSIDDNGGAITVDGTVAATQSGTWTVTGAGGSFPVTDSGGSLTVDDGGSSLTVDGTVAVSGSVAVTGTFWQATQPVSLASVPSHAVTNAGTFAVQAAQSGTWNVGTVTAVTGITNALPAGTNAIGKLAANSGVDIGDVDVTSIAAGTNTIGGVISQASTSAAYDGTTSCTIKRLSGIATASGANTLLAAVVGKKFRVLALSLLATSTTAVVAYLYNGDYMLLGDGTNKLTLDMDGVGGPAGLVLPFNQGGWFETDTANEALALNLGAATPVIWCVTYVEVA